MPPANGIGEVNEELINQPRTSAETPSAPVHADEPATEPPAPRGSQSGEGEGRTAPTTSTDTQNAPQRSAGTAAESSASAQRPASVARHQASGGQGQWDCRAQDGSWQCSGPDTDNGGVTATRSSTRSRQEIDLSYAYLDWYTFAPGDAGYGRSLFR